MKTILVVDDEPKIVELARDYLEHAGFAVVIARSTAARRSRPSAGARPDLVVLDLGLPRARRPRRHPRRSAATSTLPDRDAHRARRRAGQAPRARARRRRLRHQAVQPARARRPGAGRPAPGRAAPATPAETIRRRRPDHRRAADAGRGRRARRRAHADRVRSCSRRSPASPGRIFTRSQLLDAVHGVAFESYERAIDAHVKNLRRKLEPDPRRRATCSPSTASAIASPTTATPPA